MALDIKSPGPPEGGTGADCLAKVVRAGDDHHKPDLLAKEARFSARDVSAGRERAEAILGAWNALDHWERAHFTAFAVRQTRRAGTPPPPFTSAAAEAGAWADFASLDEMEAYAAAILVRLPEARRQGLLVSLRRMGL